MIQTTLKKVITDALEALSLETGSVLLEHPGDLSHGDYATNIAMALAKKANKNPRELAQAIVAEISKNQHPEIAKVEIAGPGFINFHLSKNFFVESLAHINQRQNDFGKAEIGKGKKMLVEYSSPNVAKPFTVGHLRSTIIGDALANIFSTLGYAVIRDNHLGDWGTQFGKQIVAIRNWSSLAEIEKSEAPMKKLVELYIKFHDEAEKNPKLEDEAREWFVKLEKGDKEANEIHASTIKISMAYFNDIYKKLGVTQFDTVHGEHFYEDVIPGTLEDIKKANIAQESDGALLVFFPDEIYPPLMVQKKDGSTLYATRDLATDKWRKQTYGADVTIINEVGAEQSLYFQQLFEVEQMLGYFNKNQRVHVGHGLYRFKDGKMSTRKGNVIWLEDILIESIKRAGEINKDTAESVGIGAIKFNDLKRESGKDIVFDWDEILNLKGDSGPYLQYTYTRSRSILEKANEAQIKESVSAAPETVSSVEKLLYRFPEVVEHAGRFYAPHYIATYLLELASAFNAYYAQNKIVDQTDGLSGYKVALTRAVSIVIKNGLTLLGIQTVEKM